MSEITLYELTVWVHHTKRDYSSEELKEMLNYFNSEDGKDGTNLKTKPNLNKVQQ